MMYTDGKFGERLRKRRQELGLDSKSVAERCCLTEEIVKRAEYGRPIIPEIEQRLAKALDTTVEHLCLGIEPGQEAVVPALDKVIKKKELGEKQIDHLLEIIRNQFGRTALTALQPPDVDAWEDMLDKISSGQFDPPTQASLPESSRSEVVGPISTCPKCNWMIFDADNPYCPNCWRPWYIAN